MSFKAFYGGATILLAMVDGAFLGGVAAIITAIGGVILGILAYRKGQQSNTNGNGNGWRAALEAKDQEILRLERELKRERRRHTRRG